MGGDINADGIADLFIGAPGHNIAAGRSYLIFGGISVGSSGLISLSQLSSKDGFKIDGENGDDSGWPVSAISDINGDGYTDLLIGAVNHNNSVGRSYVVFGGPKVGNIGSFMLTSLNGTNGFKIDGERAGDYSGYYLAAGDINGDYYSDLLIGARHYNSDMGCSYVIFGGIQVGSNGLLSLSDLDGVNGFKLNGEEFGDQSGFSLSITDDTIDFDGDGYADFLIGSPGYNNTGRSYLVFGGDKVGENGLLSLSGLNGTSGFKIDSEIVGDGSRITAAGDINGDGYGDLLIGASGHNSAMGRSYIIFGGPEVGSSGLLSLSELNGSNGFKIDGENIGDNSGGMVSGARDINDDGISDFLIGAPNYNNGIGRTYVIFGDVPPVLVNNSLVLHFNETVILSEFNLAAYDLNHDNNTLLFVSTNISHGWFETVNDLGVILSNFTQQQILAGAIQFVHDGCSQPPSYQIQVQSDGLALPLPPQSVNVTFYRQPVFIANQMSVLEGQTVLLTSFMLSVMDDYPDSQVTFVITNLQHGQFEFIPAGNLSTPQFTQQQVKAGQIQFTHDNTPQAPNYTVTATDGFFTIGPSNPQINFTLIDKPPTLLHPIPPETFAIGEGFNFKIAADTFYDEQGKPITLSSTLSDGAPLPDPDIIFDPPSATFTGLVSEADTFNISVKGTSVAGLTTPAYFLLHIAGQLPDSSSSIDIKTLVSVLGSLVGAALPVLGFLYARYHSNHRRERQDPFANKIHQRLNLSYGDFDHDRGGEKFKENIDEMKKLLMTKSKKSNIDLKDIQQQNRYADIFARVLGDKKEDLIYKVHCGCSQELRLETLKSRRAELVQKIIKAEQKPVEEFKPNSQNCCSFLRSLSRCCRQSSNESRESLLLQS